jgi:membrane-bound serine protease (ClpP class)
MDASYLAIGVALIGAGFLLLLVELFIPHGGALAIVSISCIAVGTAFTFFYDPIFGLVALLAVATALPAGIGMLTHFWSRTPYARRFLLPGTAPDDTVAAATRIHDLETLKGRFGRTLSALRPAGVVDFDGRRVDTLTEGIMVEPGQWVRCVEVRAGRVVVRPVDPPNVKIMEEVFLR